MKLRDLTSSWRGMRLSSMALLAVAGMLAVSNLVLAFVSTERDLAVVLVPPGLSERTQVMRQAMDEVALRSFSVWVAQTLGNVTPDNARFVRETLAGMLASSVHPQAMQPIEQEILNLTKDRVSTSFEPTDVRFENGDWIVGGLSSMSGPGALAIHQEPREWRIRWEVWDFRPFITALDTYNPQERAAEQKAPAMGRSP
jgi:conjugal transfer pilus assembly protein TraE